jgi:hypothetical protein
MQRMGAQNTTIRRTLSLSSLNREGQPPPVSSTSEKILPPICLVRERDHKHSFDEIYETICEIGQGGLCNVFKIQKKGGQIGGSSRPEHVRRGFLHRSLTKSSSTGSFVGDLQRQGSIGSPLYFALKVINLKLVKEDKIDQLKNEVEYVILSCQKMSVKACCSFLLRFFCLRAYLLLLL